VKHLAATLLAWCALLPALAQGQLPAPAPAPAASAVAADASARQVLVMLRLPPQHFHADASYAGRYPDDSGRAARRRVAQELAHSQGLKLLGDWPMAVIGIDCYVMEQDGHLPTQRLIDTLSRDERVLWAQPVNLYRGLGDDPLYAVQPAAQAWRLAELHSASTGRGVRLAIVDSGIDGTHPDLTGQITLRENFADGLPDGPEAHGTAVAGIIAAHAGDGIGIAGVAPGARVMALRACWEAAARDTRCSSFTLGKALNFAILHDARIINLSLGGPPDRLLQTLLEVAAARGIAVVAAADPARAGGGFPASVPSVIAVAAQPGAGENTAGALLAPGTDVLTTAPGARWGLVSGSSYAAAHASGLLALMAELRPAAGAAQLRSELVTLHGAGASTVSTLSGARPQTGTIDACATVARLTGACTCSCTTTAAIAPSRSP
jgi:subtilisin family serine protease